MPSPAAEINPSSERYQPQPEQGKPVENTAKRELLAKASPEEKLRALDILANRFRTRKEAEDYWLGFKEVAGVTGLAAIVLPDLLRATEADPSSYQQLIASRRQELEAQLQGKPNLIEKQRTNQEAVVSSPEEYRALIEQLSTAIEAEIRSAEYLNKGIWGKIQRLVDGLKKRKRVVDELKGHQKTLQELLAQDWTHPEAQSKLKSLLEKYKIKREQIEATITQGADAPTRLDFESANELTEEDMQELTMERPVPVQAQQETQEPSVALSAEAENDDVDSTDMEEVPEESEQYIRSIPGLESTAYQVPQAAATLVDSAMKAQASQEQSREAERSIEVAQTPEEQEKQLQEYARRYVEITELNQQLVVANEETMAESFAQDATLQGLQTQLQDPRFDAYRKPNGKIDSKAPLAVRRAFNTLKEQITARERKLRKQPHDQAEITLIRQKIEDAQQSAREIKQTLPEELILMCDDVVRVLHVSRVTLSKEMSRRPAFEVLQQYQEQIRQQQRAEQLAEERELSSSWERSQERGQRIIETGHQFGLDPDTALEAVQQNQWPIEVKRTREWTKSDIVRIGMEPVIMGDRERFQNALPDIQAQYRVLRSVMQPEETARFDALLEQRAQAWNAAEQIFAESNQRPELFKEVIGVTAAYNKISIIDQQLTRLMNHPKYAERKYASGTSVWATPERAIPERTEQRTTAEPIEEPDVTALFEDWTEEAPQSKDAETQDGVPAKVDLRENREEPKEEADQAA